MTLNGTMQIVLYMVLLLAAVRPLGGYLQRVFSGGSVAGWRPCAALERGICRLCGVDPTAEQHWTAYTIAMLLFNLVGMIAVYALQRLQGVLPLNPQHLPAVPSDLAFNTAASFTTNTNWQAYSGETTMSYFVQMVALAVQNFLSAATGIVLAIAIARGFARQTQRAIGNFWVDLVRCTLWVLLPFSFVIALVLVWQGVPQNLSPALETTTLEGTPQIIPQGPVASQEAIKHWGTNGGGFFNANCAHPYENPTPLANLVNMLAILAVGAALTNTFGRMVGDERQGWALLAAMMVLLVIGVSVCYWAEAHAPTAAAIEAVDVSAGDHQAGGNMEGKEVRFGIANSALFATVTTAASCGAVNGMHDSFTPLGGLVPLVNILLGEIIIGGVGSGLYGMLLFAILTVFIAGLMVGRTPEYLGKKIESREVKMAVLAILVFPLTILVLTAIACVTRAGVAGPLNTGPHGFSEILYAFTSAAGNNGSAFAGLSANTRFYNLALAAAMLIGRFLIIVPMMAVAGSLVSKKILPASGGTFPTTGPLFVALLVGVIIIVGGLTFFPATALGPVVEHLMMRGGISL